MWHCGTRDFVSLDLSPQPDEEQRQICQNLEGLPSISSITVQENHLHQHIYDANKTTTTVALLVSFGVPGPTLVISRNGSAPPFLTKAT
jgi:hypothetical protein